MKKTEAIMEILAAYDLTQSFRDAAELTGCSHHTVARYVRARDAGQLQTAPVQRAQLIDPFRKYIEGWVDDSHGRVRADVVQDKLEALGLGYAGSERTIIVELIAILWLVYIDLGIIPPPQPKPARPGVDYQGAHA